MTIGEIYKEFCRKVPDSADKVPDTARKVPDSADKMQNNAVKIPDREQEWLIQRGDNAAWSVWI